LIEMSNPADLPIACSLAGRGYAARQAELRQGVLAEAASVEALPDGYRWRFTRADVVARLGSIVDAERRCCPFLRFALVAEPALGAVTLEITGPSGTVEFLAEWIAPASRADDGRETCAENE
jgi:hypothetical protein